MQDNKKDIEYLKNTLAAGGFKVYCILRHVSASGMLRVIDLYTIKDNRPVWLSGTVATVMNWKLDNKYNGGIRVNGCGMDMGFHLVNSLSVELYCPDKYEHDEAYKLSSEWI